MWYGASAVVIRCWWRAGSQTTEHNHPERTRRAASPSPGHRSDARVASKQGTHD